MTREISAGLRVSEDRNRWGGAWRIGRRSRAWGIKGEICQEPLKSGFIWRWWKISNGGGVLGKRMKAGTGEAMTKELSLPKSEFTLTRPIVRPWTRNSSRTSRRCWPKGRRRNLNIRGDDCCLQNILGGHGDLLVPLLKIQPRENSWTSNTRIEVSNVRLRVPFWNCDVVQPSVVSTGSPSFILLLDHLDRKNLRWSQPSPWQRILLLWGIVSLDPTFEAWRGPEDQSW